MLKTSFLSSKHEFNSKIKTVKLTLPNKVKSLSSLNNKKLTDLTFHYNKLQEIWLMLRTSSLNSRHEFNSKIKTVKQTLPNKFNSLIKFFNKKSTGLTTHYNKLRVIWLMLKTLFSNSKQEFNSKIKMAKPTLPNKMLFIKKLTDLTYHYNKYQVIWSMLKTIFLSLRQRYPNKPIWQVVLLTPYLNGFKRNSLRWLFKEFSYLRKSTGWTMSLNKFMSTSLMLKTTYNSVKSDLLS